MAMHMEAEVPGIGAVGCYAEKQCPVCGKRKRQQKPLEEEDRQVWFEKLRNSLIECGTMKRVTVEPLGTKQRQQLDPSPRLDPPGTAVWGVLRQVLPQDIEKERAYERNFISFLLSKVSKETDARYMDSVNACDPSQVAAQLESVLFENWGFKDEEKERAFVRGFISFFLSKVSKETDARYMDSVNACDPSKVAAQLESVLFENWGFNEQSRNRL